jgi:hypothetical protein
LTLAVAVVVRVPTAADLRYTDTMALTDGQIVYEFDKAVGTDLAALVTAQGKVNWFNQAVARHAAGIERYYAQVQDITWTLGQRTVTLNTDFIELDKLVTTAGYVPQAWRVYGEQLVLDDSEGATQAGGARVYYWAEFPLLTIGGGQ